MDNIELDLKYKNCGVRLAILQFKKIEKDEGARS